MPRKKQRFKEVVDELNLVPVMNMVMCLIPVVLVGSSQVTIGVVNVNAPRFGSGAVTESKPDDQKPLNLTLAVGEDGYRLTASGADINEVLQLPPGQPGPNGEPPPPGPFIKKKDKKTYDYIELYNKLVKIKKAYPHESIINLTADPRIPFKHIISTMDVARVHLESESYDNSEVFMHTGIKYTAEGKPDLLWPDVVFAVAQ